MYKSPYHPQNLIITGSALYQSFKICCKATAMMHLWNNWTVTNSNCKASSWTSAVIYSVCCSVQTPIFNESRISTDVLPCQPSRKKTQQLYLDALANTSLCQSRHLPCYHISFPKTQFYTAISSSVFLQNHSTVEVRRNLWALLLQTLVKQGDSEQGALHRVQEAFEHLWRPYKPLWTNCASAPSPEQYRSASWGTEGTSCTSACDHSPCAVTGQLWKKLGSSLGRVSWHNNRSPLQTSFSRLLQGSAEQMFAQAQGWGIKCNIKVKQACS